jgi:hypothetical protein
MRKAAFLLMASALILSAGSACMAATDVVVRIPYVVNVGGWTTGLAITNLSGTEITGLTLDLVKQDGSWFETTSIPVIVSDPGNDRSGRAPTIYNLRTVIGSIAPYAMKVDFLSTLYGKTIPDSRMWCEIWHSGTEAFAVTVFVMNVTTGQAEGFGFHPFFSENRLHTFPIYPLL